VPYFVNVACSNDPPEPRRLSCADADAIVRTVLSELRLLGGAPLPTTRRAAALVRRPAAKARVRTGFTYFPPGELLPGTSEMNKGGAPSRDIHGDILFPLEDAPAFANSQVFMHGGDCRKQRIQLPKQPGDRFARYRCRQNSKQLLDFEGHAENYAYPWRDNYCEARGEGMPKGCPLERGHAGQDLRPSRCIADPANKARCKIDIFPVVAVVDGRALWKTGEHENNLKLVYDDPRNKLYYIYLHMSTKALKEAGMKRGQWVAVSKGRIVGKVGNFEHAKPGGTTAHLHFETRYGDNIGAPSNPYFTLVRAYERLIGAQGTETAD
jgi:hypothetical protein